MGVYRLRLKELLQATTKEEVFVELLKHYPDQENSLAGYYDVYDILLKKQTRKSDYVITIQYVDNKNEEDSWYDVYGVLNKVFNSGIEKSKIEAGDTIALEFTKWSTWLGSEVDVEVVHEMGINAFIAHCLFEMTFCGFCEKDVQKEIDILKYRIKESEKKDAVFFSHEEAMKRIELLIKKGQEERDEANRK
jgi:hypothetical protein